MIGKEKLLQQLDDALKNAVGVQAEAVAIRVSRQTARFACSTIHQNMQEDNTRVFFRVVDGKKISASTVNSLNSSEMKTAFNLAKEACAKLSERKVGVNLPEPGVFRQSDAVDKEILEVTPLKKAQELKAIFERTGQDGLEAAGAYTTGSMELAVVNTRGVEAYHPQTFLGVSFTVSGKEGNSGYASANGCYAKNVSFEMLRETAIRKALAGRKPKDVEPGKYTVILEPQAVGDLFEWLVFIAFTAKSQEEKYSFTCGKTGQKVIGENITIYDDGNDAHGIPLPFDFEGVPKQKVTFIEKGIAKDVVYDSYYAALMKAKTTGHAPMPGMSHEGPLPLNIFVEAGDSSVDEIIASTDRGLLVTRFHYLNGLLHPPTALFTGMTRDGTFLVENGKVSCGVKNLRFTESMVKAFSNVEAVSRERKIVGSDWSMFGTATIPAMKIKDFTFTDKTEH